MTAAECAALFEQGSTYAVPPGHFVFTKNMAMVWFRSSWQNTAFKIKFGRTGSSPLSMIKVDSLKK